jgi:glycosyltransferase involved in cell wall biosynthesis
VSGLATQRIAFVITGILDDWLGSLDLSMDDFCESMLGSWIFGYVLALKSIGIDSIIIATSRITSPIKRIHRPTGTIIHLVPPPRAGQVVSRLFARTRSSHRIGFDRWLRKVNSATIEYLSTPRAAFASILREERCTCVLVQDYETTRFDLVRSAAARFGIPAFGTFTGVRIPPAWSKPFRGYSLRRASGLVICAQPEIDRVRKMYNVGDDQILRLYYPIDSEAWFPEDRSEARLALGLPRDAVICMYHGSIDFALKGLDTLVECWERLPPCSSNRAQLLVIGNGPDADRFAHWASARPRGDVTFKRQWLHDRAALRRHLSAADAYAFPSRKDAFGIAMLEAMGCGLPVVCFEGMGAGDIFPAGEESGGIVAPLADVSAFCTALARLMADEALRGRLGRAARIRASSKDFDKEAIARRLASFLANRTSGKAE